MKNLRKILNFCLFGLSGLFLILGISTRHYPKEEQAYFERDDIARYIYKYEKLPINFVTNDENTKNRLGDGTTQSIISKDLNFGGTTFEYNEPISSFTTNQRLFEADYYPNREDAIQNGRGAFRLVYSLHGKIEVFYTENHYESFNKLSKFSLNALSNSMYISMSVSMTALVICTILEKKQIAISKS